MRINPYNTICAIASFISGTAFGSFYPAKTAYSSPITPTTPYEPADPSAPIAIPHYPGEEPATVPTTPDIVLPAGTPGKTPGVIPSALPDLKIMFAVPEGLDNTPEDTTLGIVSKTPGYIKPVVTSEAITYGGRAEYKVGTLHYDSHYAQIAAADDGYYRSNSWWNNTAQWYYGLKQAGKSYDALNKTAQAQYDTYEKYSPMTADY